MKVLQPGCSEGADSVSNIDSQTHFSWQMERVLAMAYERGGEVSASDVMDKLYGERTDSTRASTSRTFRRLERRGLIERVKRMEPKPSRLTLSDFRVQYVVCYARLTAAGKRYGAMF